MDLNIPVHISDLDDCSPDLGAIQQPDTFTVLIGILEDLDISNSEYAEDCDWELISATAISQYLQQVPNTVQQQLQH